MRAQARYLPYFLVASISLIAGCSGDDDVDSNPTPPPPPPPVVEQAYYGAANGCYALQVGDDDNFLVANGASYQASPSSNADATAFLLRPTDLGFYLLYDAEQQYLTADGSSLMRQLSLTSETQLVGDEVVVTDIPQSEGEWELLSIGDDAFRLRHLQSGSYIAEDGTLTDASGAASVTLAQRNDCATFPELSLDASGEVSKTTFEDGSVFGFVDTHSHLFSNYAFGGGGVFHGSPFHRLGVEHALEDCDLVHGEGGRRDILGFAFGDLGDIGITDLLPALLVGELSEDTHATDGYPEFTDWPNAPSSATHQMQYYKWIERAYLSGLRLMVQHATTNEVLCQLTVGVGAQPQRYDCNDMVAVNRIIEETYALERYIDAQEGGPGEGWFRIVFSPAEAREVIEAGKLAVVLGIETSDVFDCFLVPSGAFTKCTEQDVAARLDDFHDKGVRVLFPVHKFDNAFSAGDGDRRIIDLGNFAHTGYRSNFVLCSEDLLSFPGGFDKGGVSLGGLVQPRDVYDDIDSPDRIDVSGFADDPINALLPHIGLLSGDPLEGDYCQNHGLTDLGEFLIGEIMQRGMVLEVDHFPRKSYKRAFELLVENDYPAAGTHGRNNNGILYELGGISKANLGRCRSGSETATMDDGFQNRIQLMRDSGAFPAEGFGFDLNGFAGAPGPRMGPNSRCGTPQTDEGITYPFTSYGGDITLEAPSVGNRDLDFNTEGMVHLGLVAELIEDVRRDGVTDQELEPLFKSAEGYLRMWEKSEARGAALRQR